MTAAEVCGNNQGLVKMYQPALMAPSAGTSKPTVERETSTSAVVNANQSPGMLAAVMAADLAVKKVESSDGPIAIVGAYNSGTSSGQLAYYAERIAKKGYIGIALANSSLSRQRRAARASSEPTRSHSAFPGPLDLR